MIIKSFLNNMNPRLNYFRIIVGKLKRNVCYFVLRKDNEGEGFSYHEFQLMNSDLIAIFIYSKFTSSSKFILYLIVSSSQVKQTKQIQQIIILPSSF